MNRTILHGGTVIDPASGVCGAADVLVEGGTIAAVGWVERGDARLVDVSGMLVLPGLVDMHVHLREPGFEWKEDIASGAAAAAKGGYTWVAAMPNTDPPVDDASAVRFVLERAREARGARVAPIGTLTKGRRGKELAVLGEMKEAGAVAFSDDGSPVSDGGLMRHALEYASMLGLAVISHCEDAAIGSGGVMNYGPVSVALGLAGTPAAAEEAMVARDVALAALTGARVHIAHVSTRGSVELVRSARERGVRVTAEVTPHHLVLTDEEVERSCYDANTKVNPPLRGSEDVEALRSALGEGLIDVVATDHAPHHEDDKLVEYQDAAPGISGLETAVPLIFTYLVGPGILTPSGVALAMSKRPAEILGLPAGTLAIGAAADVCVIDPDLEKTVDPAGFLSKGKNTPFAGRRLKGWPVLTLRDGEPVYDAGVVEWRDRP